MPSHCVARRSHQSDLAGRGVVPLRFDGMNQTDQGVWQAPGGATVACFADPDGNTLSVTQQ